MMVSVVVIGRNEGERLRRCLRSVAAMRRGDWEVEVVYVDSGSRDGSVGLAEGMGVRVIALAPERPTAGTGRNAGWRAARGEYVLFLDGDTVLDPGFVGEALGEFADEEVAVVWGHRREMFAQASVYNRVLDLDWVYAPGLTEFCGGDALFRRRVLEATGGFDEGLIAGEEPELCQRILALGLDVLHVDLAMTGHDLAMTSFRQYWRRAVRAGHAYAEVSERFWGTGRPFWVAEVRRNRVRALGLLGWGCAAVVLSLASRSFFPLGYGLGMLAVLVLRTAWRARWKTGDRVGLLLYGVHSHLQQIPIFWGQMRYAWGRRRGVRAGLLEYKESD